MNFLRIENNKKSTVLTTLSVLLPFTFVYKLWFEAELIFNTVALGLGSYMGRVLSYCVNGAIGYLLAFAAIGWSYNILNGQSIIFLPVQNILLVTKILFAG